MKRLKAEHGIVCRLTGEKFGYFGWPSVTRMDDGTLVVSSSGLRTEHICPFGKTVLNFSRDEGRTWSAPQVINDSPLDDRDAGVLNLGGGMFLVSWFTSDTRRYFDRLQGSMPTEQLRDWEEVLHTWTEETMKEWLGSWVLVTEDGENWSEPIRVPVSTPHGPIRLSSGDLLYLGKVLYGTDEAGGGQIFACKSSNRGKSWSKLGSVPVYPGTRLSNYHEPHLCELEDGKLIGMIRFQYSERDVPEQDLMNFSLFQTESTDGGLSWSTATPTAVYGSPPHLLRHSSGRLVCVYGYRRPPYGQRAMISEDGGKSWEADFVLRDDGPDADLGYPCSVEMSDRSIFTVYYQKYRAGEKCSLLWSRWELP